MIVAPVSQLIEMEILSLTYKTINKMKINCYQKISSYYLSINHPDIFTIIDQTKD